MKIGPQAKITRIEVEQAADCPRAIRVYMFYVTVKIIINKIKGRGIVNALLLTLQVKKCFLNHKILHIEYQHEFRKPTNMVMNPSHRIKVLL